MIQSLIAKIGANLEAAKLLCWSACRAEDDRLPETFTKTFIAKYLHLAGGCSGGFGCRPDPRGLRLS